MVRLVAADMDGTLLDSRKRLSPEFMPMLEKLKANGVHFVVSSGRQYYNLRKIFPDAEKLAFICDNGSLVFEEEENIFCNEIEHGDLVAPVETIRSVGGVFAVLSGVKSAYVESENPEFLRNCLNTAWEHGNAIPCITPPESFRYMDSAQADETLSHAIDRQRIRSIQTPQCFRLSTLLADFQRQDSRSFTDEASLAEASGNPIRLCEGLLQNIKITRPFDLQLAEFLLQKGY